MSERPDPYNPLAEGNLARQVADALERQPLLPLVPERFYGSGLYALYYNGDFEPYARLKETGAPIYVGKAAARSTRIGAVAHNATKLWDRIRDHAQSIQQAENLDVADFACRYLVTSDVWVVLGEQGLLSEYGPVWNVVVDGFGNHDPGKGRYEQAISAWDTLHPGRPWVSKLTQPNTLSLSRLERIIWDALAERAAGAPVPERIIEADPLEDEQ
jgi:hypothetical protein